MKRLLVISALLICITSFSSAQTPQKFNYQAVVRDNTGAVIKNQIVSFRIAIVKTNATGSEVYAETHTPTTNDFGLVNIEVGGGTVISGSIASINWGSDLYFIKIGLDASGGSNYTLIGTSQLLSIPYALYAENAGNVADTSSTNELQALSFANDTLYLSNGGKVYLGAFMDNTDNQSLSINGNNLSITNGNTIQLNVDDNDSDPFNEIQIISLSNDTLSISNGNFLILKDNVDDSDADSTNELQVISISRDTIFLSSGSYVKLPSLSDILSLSSDADSNRITNLANPIDDQDVATKLYVDVLITQLMNENAGSNETFTSPTTGILKDVQDNSYNTVKIGLQWWMAENLKTTKYNNNTIIPIVTNNTAWQNLTSPAYCWYDNDSANYGNTYGALYNFYALSATTNGGKNVCPTGWHVSTDTEWNIMQNYLIANGYNYDGTTIGDKIAKSLASKSNWASSTNKGAPGNNDYPDYRNKSGFTALPGGMRGAFGAFYSNGSLGYWWTGTEDLYNRSWMRYIENTNVYVYRYVEYNYYGFSIRCVRD